MSSQSASMLHTRYSRLLKDVGNIEGLIEELCQKGWLSTSEKGNILTNHTVIKRNQELCKALTSKGLSRVAELSRTITDFKTQGKSTLEQQASYVVTYKMTQGRDKEREMGFPTAGLGECHEARDEAKAEGEGERIGSVFKQGRGRDNVDHHKSSTCTRLQGRLPTVQNKQEIRDVPDPPPQRLPAIEAPCDSSGSSSDSESDDEMTSVQEFDSQMEAFVVLFYMTITQLLQAICSPHRDTEHSIRRDNHDNDDKIQSSKSSARETVIPTLTDKHQWLPWFKRDINLEAIRDYFPADMIKGVNPAALSPVNLSVSVILEAFQQFFKKFELVTQENRQLGQNVQDLMKRNTQLETKLSKFHQRKERTSSESVELSALRYNEDNDPSHVQNLQAKLAKAQEHCKVLEQFQSAYVKSEERCKQLVTVTQEWAIECEGKDKLIAVQETQVKQQQEEIDQLQKRLFKYKKHWMATKDKTGAADQSKAKVSESQFEELKLELALRRELQDQVILDADQTNKELSEENTHLKQEIEELKDLIEELRDRLGNFKLQAQVKEPSVREMGLLSSENRKLKEENERLQKEKDTINDELLAYKTYVEELTQQSPGEQPDQSDSRQHPPHPPPRTTARTQAMVTGYNVPNQMRTTAAKKQPHPSARVAMAMPKSPTPPCSDDLTIEQHLHGDSCRDDTEKKSHDKDRQTDLICFEPAERVGSHDYTQQVRYPNRSGTVVRPLDDDEVSLKSERLTSDFIAQFQPKLDPVEPAPLPPNQPVATLIPGSALLEDNDPLSDGKKCPTCEHVFYTLGDRDFQIHVAGCFK